MSVFRFFAQTSPGLEEILIQELRSFSIKGRLRGDISHVQFQASYEEVFRVLHESRTIESLKIQIGNEVLARSEDELSKSITKLPWAAFLPIDTLHTYNQPKVISKSYRSNLYHEKLISTIIERQINLLQTRRDYKSINRVSTGSDFARNPSLQREIAHRKKIVDANKAAILQNRALQQQLTAVQSNTELAEITSKEDSTNNNNQLAERPSLPDIHAYLVKDRACFLMKVHFDSLHKHAIKEKVGWAPIKEGIVAGSLIGMDFKKKFEKHLRIWDPFCGSGSIVLELISMLFANRVRSKFDLHFLKNFPQEKYEAYLASPNESSTTSTLKDISIIASDISNEAIQYSITNFTSSGLNATLTEYLAKQQQTAIKSSEDAKQQQQSQEEEEISNITGESQQQEKQSEETGDIISNEVNDANNNEVFPVSNERLRLKEGEESEEIEKESKSGELPALNTSGLDQLAPFYVQEQFCENRVRFIRSDFEALSRVMDLRGYTILTNLPYGIRSAEHISDAALVSAFKRFAKTIRKNLNRLENVFIYTTVHEKYHKDHFIHISNMVWKIKQKYSLGGLQIGLFELDIVASLSTQRYQVIDEVESAAAERRMVVLEKKLSALTNSSIVDDESGQQQKKKSLLIQEDEELSMQIREIIGDRAALAKMDPKEARAFHKEEEMSTNRERLLKAASIEEPIIKALKKEQTQTPRQIKSIAQRRKVEYAKALRLRDLMQRDKQVQSVNQKEVERRVSLKRDRQSKDFLRSVMESVGVENKEDALVQIQDKLDEKAQVKREKIQEKKDKANNTSHVRNKWF